ncbi:hypothetical protein ACFFF7_13830 [Novosphingobium aquiterrae]|uniref:Uncharacterized protein n=1 Tax=Novosphingobium aquiterrae TaxID=624388 RepID=A0ABV6PKW8_9SPHN
MLIRPELAALRSDDAPQRRAQAAMGAALEHWQGSAPVVSLADELGRWDTGAAIDGLPLLAALFTAGDDTAQHFCAEVMAVFLRELQREPLGQTPLRHYLDDTVASLTLLRRGMTVLSLQMIDGTALSRLPPAETARFVPCETWDHILAGTAQGDRVRIAGTVPEGVCLARAAVMLGPGDVQHRLGCEAALCLSKVDGALVTLRLQRRAGCNDVTREYALSDGSLLHQAAGSPRDSRLELTAALLGRMGRRDASPLLGAMAEEQGASGLRWQVLRECLALDTAQGFSTLARIAVNAADPLAASAGALHAQLIETYPQLNGIAPCPA